MLSLNVTGLHGNISYYYYICIIYVCSFTGDIGHYLKDIRTMSTYKYSLYDYHAIKSAEIELPGITVISGVNGSGKSTLSKWLFYLVNESTHYNQHVVSAFLSFIIEKTRRVDMIRRDIRVFSERFGMFDSSRLTFDTLRKIRNIDASYVEAIDIASDIYFSYLNKFIPQLQSYLEQVKEGARRERVVQSLDIEVKSDKDTSSIVHNFFEVNRKEIEDMKESYLQIIEKRPLSNFFYNIQSVYHEDDEVPKLIQLKENGVQLLNVSKHVVSELYYLKRAIYIDTPMSVSMNESGNFFWSDLMHLMMSEEKSDSIETKKMLLRVRNIIKGQAKVEKDAWGSNELHFVSSDGLDIKLEKAATGFKTFAYLQKLVENGHINDKTLLLIDEPEAHLHPQWIVEFAHILVLLHKNLGLKLMIASHNPDMVSAISAIAQKEGIDDNVRFYLSTLDKESNKYVFKNLGNDISEIFISFNIALDRINQYGNTDKAGILE